MPVQRAGIFLFYVLSYNTTIKLPLRRTLVHYVILFSGKTKYYAVRKDEKCRV
jgi:hypothetical protein